MLDFLVWQQNLNSQPVGRFFALQRGRAYTVYASSRVNEVWQPKLAHLRESVKTAVHFLARSIAIMLTDVEVGIYIITENSWEQVSRMCLCSSLIQSGFRRNMCRFRMRDDSTKCYSLHSQVRSCRFRISEHWAVCACRTSGRCLSTVYYQQKDYTVCPEVMHTSIFRTAKNR